MTATIDIERSMLYAVPADADRNCERCYQYNKGRCEQYDLPVKDGVRCGLFARPTTGKLVNQ